MIWSCIIHSIGGFAWLQTLRNDQDFYVEQTTCVFIKNKKYISLWSEMFFQVENKTLQKLWLADSHTVKCK